VIGIHIICSISIIASAYQHIIILSFSSEELNSSIIQVLFQLSKVDVESKILKDGIVREQIMENCTNESLFPCYILICGVLK
jgi:hypothetical protein